MVPEIFTGNTPALSAGTYYVRTFATNGIATSYGSEETVLISTPNNAPVIDNSQDTTLTEINQNAGDDDGSGVDGDDDATNNSNNQGDSVAAIVVDGSITDADGAVEAIAVQIVDNTNGVWQYSLNNGTSFNNFTGTTGTNVSMETSARLLDGTC